VNPNRKDQPVGKPNGMSHYVEMAIGDRVK
jgi:hypothetical protein